MKCLKAYFFFAIIFFFLFVFHFSARASIIEDEQFAQLSTNILFCYTPGVLVSASMKAGKMGGNKSIYIQEKILKKCDEFDYSYTSKQSGNQTDIARAYAMFYLAAHSAKIPFARGVIEDHFALKRPICIALTKAKYKNLYKLLDNEISRLFSKYPSTIRDETLADEISVLHPGIKYILNNRYDSKDKVVDKKLLNAMLNFALSIETIRASKYLKLCNKVLNHDGSYLWDKPLCRSAMKIKSSDFNKHELIKNRFKSTRNSENDNCEWDFNNPETISFSIKNISSEAYLILSLWRLNVELKKKISETMPSLESSSFSAKAMAIDRLATDEKAIPALNKVLESNDDNLKRFLALRLADETNASARKLLKKLAEDSNKEVSDEAKNALVE